MRLLHALVRSMRPRQWTKNLLVFAALIFSNNLLNVQLLARASLAFVLFCFASGAVYLFNDVIDAERDRLHEKKRHRPIASGELSVSAAVVAMLLLTAVSVSASLLLGVGFLLVILTYIGFQVGYSLELKRHALLDVMAISAGFVMRALAGIAAIQVGVSTWLLVCTALLALFLALGKRRHELLLLEDIAAAHRAALHGYSSALIDQLISSTTAMTIMSYTLYTFFPSYGAQHEWLLLTVPFVMFGLFRYLRLVYLHDLGGSPEEILLTDRPLLVDIILFVIVTAVILYLP